MLIGYTEYLPELHLSWGDNLEFALRILISGILGIIIGLERARRLKDAGIRTHFIIACSAATFMILSKYGNLDLVVGDPGRIAAQVVCGISFLGTGVIFKQGNSVKGLTTAAGIWATAAVGMAIGSGMYCVGLFLTVTILLAQFLMHRFKTINDVLVEQEIVLIIEKDTDVVEKAFMAMLVEHGAQILASSITKEDRGIRLKMRVRLEKKVDYVETKEFMKQYKTVQRFAV